MWLSAKLLRDPNLQGHYRMLCSMLMPLRCCLETNRILQNLYFKARASDMSKNADLQLANCIKAKTSQKKEKKKGGKGGEGKKKKSK